MKIVLANRFSCWVKQFDWSKAYCVDLNTFNETSENHL